MNIKEILTMLTVGTLATTNASTINIILNSNSNSQKTEIVDLKAKVFGLTFKNDNLYVGTWNNKIYKIKKGLHYKLIL